jgi:transposase
METGTHSPWIARLARVAGHEVFVADARRLKVVTENARKSDRRDAELLALLGCADLELLRPVYVRSEQAQKERAVMRMRDTAVRSRSMHIACLRNVVKTDGLRLPSCDAQSLARAAWDALPPQWRALAKPILRLIIQATRTIREYDRQVEAILREHHPECSARLQQVAGVGPLTALALISLAEDPRRFRNGRQLAAYIGLVPKTAQSGQSDPNLGISKEGDGYARRLLVSAAHYILERGPDTDLKRWGLGLEARWGPKTRKRAAVAVARKLAALLWRLWVSPAEYQPLHVAAA